ncbi:long-chain fatty acid--CoA ligase [Actinocorallia libanotica]|uniref:Long-chain fatty acid--CoA ligase n=2 Tax=Actinocorallia libanotica TaxID=46162 RepID=A0ABN1RMF1_9ACTN
MDIAEADEAGAIPTMPRLIRRQAASFASKRFLVCDSDVLRYDEAERRSALLARGLLAAGVGKGMHVGLLYPNGSEFAVAALAVTRIGAVAVPISTMSTAHELRALLRQADVRFLLAADSYRSRDFVETVREAVPGFAAEADPPVLSSTVPTLRHVWFSGAESGAVPARWRAESLYTAAERVGADLLRATEDLVRPADPFVIVHTSGSAGDPKGVVHTHGSLLRHAADLNRVRGYGADDILFSNSPFFWIGGFAAAFLITLAAGARLVCSGARDAGEVLDLIERERPTLCNGFAQTVAHLAEHPSFPGRDLSSLRRGNLYPVMPDGARPADPELRHNMLGMTETGGICLLSEDEGDQPEHRRGSFGRPAPGLEARVRTADGAECGPGEVGELHFRGPSLMAGYHGRERRETFDPDGWYATGDLVSRDADGFLYFKGRRSEMIKTSGANVSPREVERAIHDVTGLRSHVVGVEDAGRGQIVAAAVIAADPEAVDEAGLRAGLAERLSPYKIPRRVRTMTAEQLPMTTSGKPDLRSLRKLLE